MLSSYLNLTRQSSETDQDQHDLDKQDHYIYHLEYTVYDFDPFLNII
jgi:hypothetical protein